MSFRVRLMDYGHRAIVLGLVGATGYCKFPKITTHIFCYHVDVRMMQWDGKSHGVRIH
jgi:hypothetical protein